MKRSLVLASALLFFSACSFWRQANDAPKNPDPNHTHADFAIWIEGRQLDFNTTKYMSEPPAEPESPEESGGIPSAAAHEGIIHSTPEEAAEHENLRKYLHLHDGNGKIIHRHTPGLTFLDFLRSLGFDLTTDCLTLDTGEKVCNTNGKTWKMFVNEAEIPVTPDYEFKDLDRILLTYGADEAEITRELAALTDEACLYSKTCPERGEPPVENCIADPEVPCVLQE